MKTVILCGGKGTRLREHTESIPKPLVEVGPYPILWHIMKLYSAHQFREFVLCLGYLGHSIKQYFLRLMDAKSGDFRLRLDDRDTAIIDVLRSRREPWDIVFAETGLETDTGGRLHKVRDYTGGERFFLTYGDGLSDLDLQALLAFHQSHGRAATVTAVRPRTTMGVLAMDDDDRVTRFNEKPLMEYFVNGGFFVFEPSVFEFTTPTCNLERDVLPKLAENEQLMAYKYRGFWSCMDTYKDNITLSELWNNGDAPWKIWDTDNER